MATDIFFTEISSTFDYYATIADKFAIANIANFLEFILYIGEKYIYCNRILIHIYSKINIYS